jgi:hypothetical protein
VKFLDLNENMMIRMGLIQLQRVSDLPLLRLGPPAVGEIGGEHRPDPGQTDSIFGLGQEIS